MAISKFSFDNMKEILLNHINEKMDISDIGLITNNGYPLTKNAFEDIIESMINHGKEVYRNAHGLAILKKAEHITPSTIQDAKILNIKGVDSLLDLIVEKEW